MSTEYVLRSFNNDACKSLKGKPKFFVFQACRGDDVDYGIIPELEKTDSQVCLDQHDAKSFREPVTTIAKDPTWEDMVILFATVPGYVAQR